MENIKLHLNGENLEDNSHELTTSLGFVRTLNNNADKKFKDTGYKMVKLDLETHNTPEAIAKALLQSSNLGTYPTPSAPDSAIPDDVDSIVPDYNEAMKDDDVDNFYTVNNVLVYIDGVLHDSYTTTKKVWEVYSFHFNLNKYKMYLKDILSGDEKVPYTINRYDRDDYSIYINAISSFNIELYFITKPIKNKPSIEVEPNSPSMNNIYDTGKYKCVISYAIDETSQYDILEHGLIYKRYFGNDATAKDITSITLEAMTENPNEYNKMTSTENLSMYYWRMGYPSQANSYQIPISFRAYAILKNKETNEQITVYSSNPCILSHIEHFN